MDYSRNHQGAAAALPQHMYSLSHTGYVEQNEDEQDGYELEQTAMAALKDLDNGGQNAGIRWGARQYNNNHQSSSGFDVRKYGEGSVYAPQANQASASSQSRQINNHPQQQTSQQQLQPVSSPTMRQAQPSSMTLNGAIVERSDYREAADFILRCKSGNEAAALDFLRGVFLVMTSTDPTEVISTETHDWDSAVKNGPPYLTPEDQAAAQAQLVMNQHNSILLQAQRMGVPPRPPPIVPIALIGDEIDQRLSTLVILVPGRAHIVGHLIGKGGAEVGKIEREMSVTIKIEAASKMGVPLVERSVCIIGSVSSTTQAQQLVSHKVHEKLLSEGVQAEVLKMVVPNEIVRHLIGKNGANINRLQSESGARIQVEPESTMSPGSVGRTIVLQGAERCRTFAQYLILRQIAEDRNVHSEWAGRTHPNGGPTSPTAAPVASPISPPAQTHPINGALPFGSPQTINPQVRQQPTPAGVQHEEETVAFTVPEQAVAFLIGRSGASVMEIQNQTGARVHIARGGGHNHHHSGGHDDSRRVTVSGSARSVEAAQHLIRSRVQLALSAGVSPQHTLSFQGQQM